MKEDLVKLHVLDYPTSWLDSLRLQGHQSECGMLPSLCWPQGTCGPLPVHNIGKAVAYAHLRTEPQASQEGLLRKEGDLSRQGWWDCLPAEASSICSTIKVSYMYKLQSEFQKTGACGNRLTNVPDQPPTASQIYSQLPRPAFCQQSQVRKAAAFGLQQCHLGCAAAQPTISFQTPARTHRQLSSKPTATSTRTPAPPCPKPVARVGTTVAQLTALPAAPPPWAPVCAPPEPCCNSPPCLGIWLGPWSTPWGCRQVGGCHGGYRPSREGLLLQSVSLSASWAGQLGGWGKCAIGPPAAADASTWAGELPRAACSTSHMYTRPDSQPASASCPSVQQHLRAPQPRDRRRQPGTGKKRERTDCASGDNPPGGLC